MADPRDHDAPIRAITMGGIRRVVPDARDLTAGSRGAEHGTGGDEKGGHDPAAHAHVTLAAMTLEVAATLRTSAALLDGALADVRSEPVGHDERCGSHGEDAPGRGGTTRSKPVRPP